MDTKLTITLPKDLRQRAKARAAREGVTLSQVVRRHLEKFAEGVDEFTELSNNGATKNGVQKPATSEQDQSAVSEDVKADLAILTKLKQLSEEISKDWPEGVSAVDAIREVRREL